MTDYLIFIYDNSTDEPILEHIPFSGDLYGAKAYAFSIADCACFTDIGIMIWKKADYHNDLDSLMGISIRYY